MKSVFFNGGVIGATLDFVTDERYVIGQTTELATLVYVGGRTQSGAGTSSNISVSLTSLTGGTNTAPQAGDLVLIAIELSGTTDKSYRISGYDEIVDLRADDTYDSNLQVGRKFMTSTPDTTATITGGSGSFADAYALAIQVWRNVDTTTPLDVTSTTNSQINTGIPDPPAITPVTAGAQIVVAAGTAHNGGVDTFTASYLSNFLTAGANDDVDATIGMGNILWTSGEYNPAAWTFSQTDSTQFSTNSVTMALRPATVTVPIYGNLKNSGLWILQAVWDALFIYPGQAAYTTAGTYSFEVPAGVTSISAVAVGGGGGGGGGGTDGGGGGGGGALAYSNNIAVTPGETLTVVVGANGNGGNSDVNGAAGGLSRVHRSGTDILVAAGGSGGIAQGNGGAGGTVAASTGDVKYAGGAGANVNDNGGGGGGGAAGYGGNGGAGGTTTSSNAPAGGGGSGGGGSFSNSGGGGGGVGILGEGSSGTGVASSAGGIGGSGGGNGTAGGNNIVGGTGGLYGGGGGGSNNGNEVGGPGRVGAVRIIWGTGRAYPSTNTGDL